MVEIFQLQRSKLGKPWLVQLTTWAKRKINEVVKGSPMDMNGILRDYLNKFVIVFLDDILIYSKYEEEHEQHLRMVLQVLKEHQLYAKLTKCSFYLRQIHYLGHII
jgi:hypothetical protein